MKPLGPIPAGYVAIDGELAVGGRTASALVEAAGGTPLFVYSADLLRRRMADLRASNPMDFNVAGRKFNVTSALICPAFGMVVIGPSIPCGSFTQVPL